MLNHVYHSHELSAGDYHAEKDHESSTSLKSILITPAHYLHNKQQPKSDTEALRIGTAIHAAILEPEVFDQTYVVVPKFDRRTTQGKADYEAFTKEHTGKRILMAEDRHFIEKLRISIMRSPEVYKLLALPGRNESSIFWTDDETGVKLKVRPDRLLTFNGSPVHISIKTAACAGKESFRYDIEKYRYHFSEAMYAEGIAQEFGEQPITIWLVFEKDTWQIAKYPPCERTMALGHHEFRHAVHLLKKCRDMQEFLGYQKQDEFDEISLPERAFRRAEQAGIVLP